MPLTPHYQWTETEASLEVTVDVPGVSRAKADVFATDAFLKVNCPPYLFALDLLKEVDDSRSSATIVPGGVVFNLFKREPGLWGSLAASGDKAELTRRRNASIDRAYREVEAARKARLERKQQEDKNATQRSMEVDRRKRQEVERRKAEELAEERGRLQEWQQGLAQGGDAESDYEDEEGEEEEGEEGRGGAAATRGSEGPGSDPAPDHPDYYGRGWRPPHTAAAKTGGGAAAGAGRRRGGGGGAVTDSGDEDDDEGGGGSGDGSSDGEVAAASGRPAAAAATPAGVPFKPLPPPRARLEPVQVSFTQLETGHLPAREQREVEIREFRKQSRAAAAADPDAVDLAERQPLFLKDKGDELFRKGNYSGALNAYSRAIQLDDVHAAVRANRAACRLALGEAGGCAEDCDRALELLADRRDRLDRDLLDPAETAALRRQLVRLLVRRAQARVAMAGRGGGRGGGGCESGGGGEEALAAALRDYEAAIRLAPSDPSLESDYEELLAALKPADAAALRQRGDARFRSGDFEGAAEAFSALLGLPRSRVPESERLAAFSNRAACNLILERYGAAVADCDAGLALLLLPAAAATASGADFGVAAGEAGLTRLRAWAQSLALPNDDNDDGVAATAAAAPPLLGGAGLAPAAAAAAAARLLTRRGAAAAHQQRFAAAAADHRLAAELLGRMGEAERAAAAAADAERMVALAEGREQPPPRAQTQPQAQQEGQQEQLGLAASHSLPGEAVREGEGAVAAVTSSGRGQVEVLPPPMATAVQGSGELPRCGLRVPSGAATAPAGNDSWSGSQQEPTGAGWRQDSAAAEGEGVGGGGGGGDGVGAGDGVGPCDGTIVGCGEGGAAEAVVAAAVAGGVAAEGLEGDADGGAGGGSLLDEVDD